MAKIMVVKSKNKIFNCDYRRMRKELMKQATEGLMLIDEDCDITVTNIDEPLMGVMFNIDEEEEDEKSKTT